jgi:hypothetical protein
VTAQQLRQLKNKSPFKPFTIHMNSGESFVIKDPESLVIHPDWTVEAIVFQPRGRFSFVYLRNVTHVSGEGIPPVQNRRRRRSSNGD